MDYTQHNYRDASGKRHRNPLSRAWTNMKQRAKTRTNCEVMWESYLEFVEWSLANGFRDGLTLCRNGDTGNYEPNNCRWDTQANNTIEAQARQYNIARPDGQIIQVYNMNQFCKDNNLNSSHMSKVIKGELAQHKGYKLP